MREGLSHSILAASGLAVLWLLSRSPKRGSPRKPSRSKDTPPVDVEARWKASIFDHARCTGDRYLIIGVGFLGQRIIDILLLRGETKIVAFDLKPSPRHGHDSRIMYILGDVTNFVEVEEACKGVDVVFATFALIRFQDRLECQAALSQHVNVHGTENVVAACKASGVKRLVVTSTNMAVVSRQQCSNSMDESSSYVDREGALNHYSWTKAAAERHALDASGPNLDISVIRICSGMIGPADRILTQKFQDYGFMLMPNPLARIDFVYVDNIVWGHLLAERALVEKRFETRGQVFCITNGEPMTIEEMLTGIQHFKPSLKVGSMPYFLWGMAYIIEWLLWCSGGSIPLGPLEDLTPAALLNASLSYTFSHDKASKTLGYAPLFTMSEAFQLCVTHNRKSP